MLSISRPSPRVVISMTTIPSRLNSQKLKDVIKALQLNTLQPEAIYLTIPDYCRKLDKPYPEPDDFIKTHCKIVRVRKDYGPILKIAGALIEENESDTIIITCDDDIIPSHQKIENLYKKCLENRNSVICSTGFIIGNFPFYFSFVRSDNKFPSFLSIDNRNYPEGIPVDILFGYTMVGYRRGFFHSDFAFFEKSFLSRTLEDSDIFFNDDVFLSAYLNSRRIEILAFSIPSVLNDTGPDAISGNMKTFIYRFLKSVKKCNEWSMWKSGFVYSDIDILLFHTMTSPIFFLCVVIIIYYVIRAFNREKYQGKVE